MPQLIVMVAPNAETENKTFLLLENNTVGSSSANDIVLESPTQPFQIKIDVSDESAQLAILSPNIQMDVNGTSVEKTAKLAHGDMITVGDYTLLYDDQSEVVKPEPSIDECMQSRIESQQKVYASSKDVLEDTLNEPEKSQKHLVTLYRISNAISGILDLDQLLKSFLDIILDEFSADNGFIILLKDGELVPAAVASNKKVEQNAAMSRTIIDQVLSTKESILCENIMDDDTFKARESIVRQNIMSVMCVPLVSKKDVLGLIHLESHQQERFSSSDLNLLTKVALQASMVIENASLYKGREQFNQNLLALSRATQNISSYLRLELIIRDATQDACRIFGCQKGYLILQNNGEMELAHTVGTNQQEKENLTLNEAFKELINKNESLLVRNKKEIPASFKQLHQQKYFSNSFVIVPISNSQENVAGKTPAVGLLCVSHKSDKERFSIEDRQLLTILAQYTAVAISNFRFYQELKRKEEEIAKWNQELEKRVEERAEKVKSMQGQLVQSEKMAAVGLLAAGVSHEFNNIIASMYGFAQIAKTNDKYKDKLVDIVINQSKRACDITEGLLSFSKQRGEVEELINIPELIENVLKLTMSALENEGIEIVKEFEEGLPLTMANPNKIQQVLLNIIINARHAIERVGTISIRVSSKEGQWIHANFSDTGKGIKEEDLERVFEPFFTTKGSFGGGTQPGTGIGLSLCYNIMKSHGGEIIAKSEVGKGSTFTVILPIRKEVYTEKVKKTSKKSFPQVYGHKRVLVVEDTENLRDLLTRILQEKGLDICAVNNGSDAIERCKKEKFDLVLLDVRMPGVVDGFGVFDEVRRLEPDIKIILLTGRAEDDTLMNYVGHANGYLRKPFHIDDVHQVIASVLN